MDHEMMESMGHEPMMTMHLHFGLGDEIFISGLVLDSYPKLCAACLILFIASFMVEAIVRVRSLRCRCELKSFKGANGNHHHEEIDDNHKQVHLCCSGDKRDDTIHCELELFRSDNISYRLVQALFQTFQTVLTLTIMLAAMTFNVCLILSIALGAGFGVYLFPRPLLELKTVCC